MYPLAAFCSRWLTGLRHWKHLCTLGLFFGLLFFCHEERFAQQNWHSYKIWVHSECLYEGLTDIFRQRYLSSGVTPLCIDQLKAGFWEVCCYHFSACSLALYDNFTVLVVFLFLMFTIRFSMKYEYWIIKYSYLHMSVFVSVVLYYIYVALRIKYISLNY